MIPKRVFIENLLLTYRFRKLDGSVVECGVWRGGMIAAMANLLGNSRTYYLFDSFEGLPPVKDIDGPAAKIWQQNKDSPFYYDNCRAEKRFAEQAMKLSAAKLYHISIGWFKDTLPGFNPTEQIAILRLDADWYESTKQCLDCLWKNVAKGGLIIIDDYYTWDGCAKATHEFLAENKLSVRVFQSAHGVCYLVKT